MKTECIILIAISLTSCSEISRNVTPVDERERNIKSVFDEKCRKIIHSGHVFVQTIDGSKCDSLEGNIALPSLCDKYIVTRSKELSSAQKSQIERELFNKENYLNGSMTFFPTYLLRIEFIDGNDTLHIYISRHSDILFVIRNDERIGVVNLAEGNALSNVIVDSYSSK